MNLAVSREKTNVLMVKSNISITVHSVAHLIPFSNNLILCNLCSTQVVMIHLKQ